MFQVQNFADANPGQPTSFIPSSIGTEAPSWTIHRVDNGSTQNGFPPNSTYSYLPHTQLATNEGMNGSTTASSSTLAPASVPQDYSGYTTYQNPTADSYGYGNTGYTNYYSGYQQQTSHSYSQPVAAYPNTGHPYQPLSSFQNTGSYAAPANYSSTYYNPGDYQTSAGYPTTNYSNQASQWNEGNYANYSSYQFLNYTPTSAGAYGSATAPAAPLHYQSQHLQYFGQSHTEVTCAPGTEDLSASTTTKLECPIPGVPGITGDHSTTTSQPQQPSAVSWRPECTSFQLPPQQV